MHALTFELKRAHWRGVGFGRQLLEEIPGMTPARFEVLFLIFKTPCFGHPRGATRQNTLTRLLGLHPSTVSQMLDVLRGIGWIEPRTADRRSPRLVVMTEAGVRALRLAIHVLYPRAEDPFDPVVHLFSDTLRPPMRHRPRGLGRPGRGVKARRRARRKALNTMCAFYEKMHSLCRLFIRERSSRRPARPRVKHRTYSEPNHSDLFAIKSFGLIRGIL